MLCKICYSNVRPAECVVSCKHNHQWCRECLAGYLSSKIAENSLSVLCPDIDGPRRCTEVMSEELILDVCEEETLVKFRRWRAIASNPHLRECPGLTESGEVCGHSQAGKPRKPQMTCEKCGYVYCYHHANAHPGVSCKAYEKAQRRAESESLWLINQCSKPCPKCGIATQKSDGCNHMTCRECEQDWCWICGRKTGKHGGNHYAPFNPFGCPGLQMSENFINTQSYCRTVLNFMFLANVSPQRSAPQYHHAIV